MNAIILTGNSGTITYRQAYEGRMEAGGIGQCIISGLVGPIAPTHEKIKGISSLGGQPAGVSLMSFDKSAFRSYHRYRPRGGMLPSFDANVRGAPAEGAGPD